MDDRIKKVMSAVLEVDESKIDEKISPDTLEQWDSLKHMTLIVALEEEFGVQFNETEIVEMVSLPLIKVIIKGKITNN